VRGDHRTVALDRLVAVREPLDEDERSAIGVLRELLRGDADAFLRTTLPTHVTASAIIVDPTDGRVLLHLHRRIGRWLQPGGHIEPDEAPEDAAIRESVEETGVDVWHPTAGPLLLHVDEHPGPDGHVHLDLRYLLHAHRGAVAIASGEATGGGTGPMLRWLTSAEAGEVADRSLARALQALEALAVHRGPAAPEPPAS
jgi:8-oxo-dGTP pyrophosphatase MutT (NUDIX family)